MSVENIVVDIEINNSIAPDIEQSIVATIDNNINVIKDDTDDLDVTINRKEYVITGDEIYIPKRYEDAPTWLQNMIDQVVEYSIGAKVSDMNQVVYSLNQMIEAMEVSKNTYEMSVISSNDIDTRINTAITTLNSNMNEADATILSVANTKTTPEEAEAIMINAVRAELERTEAGTIGAAVATLSTAIANESEARSTSVETLYSTMEGEFEATATAMNYLNTYVGVTEIGEKSGTGLLADVEILQKQNDGVIETTTGTYDVMINPENPNLAQLVTTSEPYATWRALDATGISSRLAHIGDVYVKYSDTANGAKEYIASYKFIRTIVDETSPYATDSEGFTWALIIDQAAQDAYEQALNAFDLADNKRRVFVSNPTVPYDIGDLWLVHAGSNIIGTTQGGRVIQAGDMLRCSETKEVNGLYEHNDWIPADNYRESMNAIQADLNSWRTGTYAPFVTSIQTQVDGKSETFYQNSIPSGRTKSLNVASNSTLDKYLGDLWKNIYVGTVGGYLGNNTEYVYTKTANGSNWNYDWKKMEVPDIVFDTIDTKKSIYSGNSVPVAVAPDIVEINDMWITGSAVVSGYDKESIYVWNGTSWIKPLKYTDDSTVISLSNGLANGTVTLNLSSATIDGNVSLSSYVSAEIDKEVVVYSGSNHNAQTGMKTNDIYIEKTTAVSTSGITIDVVNTWKYNGTVWIQIGNNSNLTALADLTDGKRTIYSGGSLPVNSTLNPLRPNDLFIPTSTFTANSVTYTANEMYRYNGTSWEKATRYDEIKSLLSAQIDNKIETTYGGAIPPYANQTNVVKDPRGGDYWYCDTNGSYSKGNVYKYAETANGSKFNYTWTLSSDISKGAFDLADKKRIIFGNAGNSIPTLAQGLALADIWIPSSDGTVYFAGKVYKCTNLSPITFIEVNYTNDEVVNGIINGTTPLDPNIITIGNTSTTFLEYLISEIDSKVAIYSGESAPVAGQPVGVAANDIYLWFTTASKVLANGATQVYDITRTYKYSGSVWNEITTDSNITALADLADGKRTVFSGNTVPVGAVNRDVWIPSATNGVYIKGEIYQYNGTSWIIATKYSADIESVRENLQGQIDGKVDTYYQGTVPAGMTALNNGDYWYCTADISTYKKGKVYKYAHATTSWVETADVSRYAFDTADGKASIFTSTDQPTAYKINDMLIVTGSFNNGTTTFSDGVVLSSNATRTAGFVAADWVKKINDTEDLDLFVSSVYNPAVLGLQSQIDGKIENWFTLSTNDPKVSWVDADTKLKHNGDLWYQTDTKISYYYTSSTHTWNILDDAKAIQALANAATAQTAANNAQTSANTAQTAANTANTLLADIASDSKFTPSEKYLVKKEWDSIQSEYTKNLAQGTSYSVSTAAYTTAYNALNTYITPLLDSLTTTSDIVGTTFRATFKSYYDANVDLLNAVSNKINLIADGKITSYYMATFSAVQAMSTAWTAIEKASNIGDLAVVYNDTTVDNNGTWRWDGANWVTTRDKKLVALASQVTALSTDLQSGDGTWADADSTLTNSLTTTIKNKTAAVESKFAYNSIIGINGIYKKSGFGLTTNYVSGSGTEVDPYVSEFWIDASRFKFTNSNVTGSKAPFTIDATGTVPEITFNGKVAFTNVTGYTPTDTSSSNMIKNSEFETGISPWALGWSPNGSTIASFGLSENIHNADWIITGSTGSLTLRQIGRNTSTANDDIGIDIYPQGSWDYTKGYAVEAGKTYEFSVYVATNRCKAKIGLVFFNSSGVQVVDSSIDYVTPLGGGKTIDGYTRIHVRATAPTGSATALLFVRKKNTDAGQADSWMWIARPFFGKVDTNSVAPIDYIASDGSLANNNTLAQKLGYSDYNAMVAAATNGKTIINGGYLRTSLIEANSIVANQINTTGLIAENISANTISGKTITGGTISGNTISGNTISGGTVTGTSIIGGSISGATGTFSGEMTVGKFGNANMIISNGIAYIPIIDFGSIELSTIGIYDGDLKYVETTGPLLRSTCSFQITGVASVGSYSDGDSSTNAELFVYYSVDNGGTWVQFAKLIGSYGNSSFTVAFSASGVSAVANSRIRIRIASQRGSFSGSIIVSNFS